MTVADGTRQEKAEQAGLPLPLLEEAYEEALRGALVHGVGVLKVCPTTAVCRVVDGRIWIGSGDS